MNRAPLKRMVEMNGLTLSETTDPSREFRYLDIGAVGRGSLVDEPQIVKFADAPSRARRIVRDGDTIVSTVRTYLRAAWPVSDARDDLVVSTGFVVLTPTPSVDPRFLGWLAQSDALIEEVVARSVGVSYPAISPEEVGNVAVPLPALSAQRVIAAYLDAETSRVDALIAKKRQMIELLEEFRESFLVHVFEPYSRVPLRRLARRIDVGIAEAATHAYADEGVPLVRSTNIRRNSLDVLDMLHIEPWFAERNRSKYIHGGDILTVRTGDAGVSAVVPSELDGSQCFTQLITTLEPGQPADLVCVALNCGDARQYFLRSGWGSAQQNISVPLLAAVPIPVIPLREQEAVRRRVNASLAVTNDLRLTLTRQIALLDEHRQALITAAVTGEIDMPGAAA